MALSRKVPKSQSDKDTPAVPGWKFSWLVRLVQHDTSWVAPQAVEQIPMDSTANQVAGSQVLALDKQSTRPKVAVLDSGYFNHCFLALCVALKTVLILVRMRRNCTLYERPDPKPPKSLLLTDSVVTADSPPGKPKSGGCGANHRDTQNR